MVGHSGVAFPILVERPRGKKAKRKFLSNLAKMPPSARREILRVQPYRDGKNARSHPLWVLHQLDIIDKHRQITAMGGRFSMPDSKQPLVIDQSMLWQDGRIYVPFNEGDVIHFVGVDDDFRPDITGNVQFRWDDGPAFFADIDKLTFVANHVIQTVLPRFARFFP